MGRRIAYGLLGLAIGALIFGPLSAIWRPHDRWLQTLSSIAWTSCGPLAVYIAERTGKVKSIEELRRPLTLFPREPA
jgi:hypothetical protein